LEALAVTTGDLVSKLLAAYLSVRDSNEAKDHQDA